MCVAEFINFFQNLSIGFVKATGEFPELGSEIMFAPLDADMLKLIFDPEEPGDLILGTLNLLEEGGSHLHSIGFAN